jgi:hypothetical protein
MIKMPDERKELLIKDIICYLNKCNDISLLDLIHRLLKKSIQVFERNDLK